MLILLHASPTAPGIEEALGAAPDAIMLDLFDRPKRSSAVVKAALGMRGEPSEASGRTLFGRDRTGVPLLLRAPPLASGKIMEELDAAMVLRPDGFFLTGAAGRPEIEQLGAKLTVLEAEHGRADGSIGILASAADHAAATLALAGLRRNRRLAGLVFDQAALMASLGCAAGARVLAQAAAKMILTASACGVPALIRLTLSEADEPQQATAFRFADEARREGFGGILANDPSLVAALRAVRPSPGASSRTSSRASRQNSRGSRPA